MAEPTRYLSSDDRSAFTPVHAVWEITLACDLKCQHCGSRAGARRPQELSTQECKDLIRQLARLGTREVTLIGGEAYLRRDWLELIAEIRDQGMDCTMQSGGLHLNEERIRAAAQAGLQAAGVSIDGLAEVHDKLRGVKGSFDAALNALRLFKNYGLVSSVNTQITSLVIPQLRELMDLYIDAGASNWQIQLTVAMGRAADNPELLLQPFQILELMPVLAELYEDGTERGLLIQPGNNIGYFGPYEHLWRGSGDDRIYWTSCNAGQNTLGIEADGTIKGCPSLPTTPYGGGNIRDKTLKDIWWQTDELSFTRNRTVNDLWGYCRSCYYADVCRAGCTWTTSVLFGRAGNNPFCHHRALDLERQGLRERIVQVEAAPGKPFDHGLFELVLEGTDGQPLPVAVDEAPDQITTQTAKNGSKSSKSVSSIPLGNSLVQILPAKKGSRKSAPTTTPAFAPVELIICRGCNRHVKTRTEVCPHCDGDVVALNKAYEKKLREDRKAYQRLLKLLAPV